MSSNIHDIVPQGAGPAEAAPANIWSEAEEFLHRQVWPDAPRGAYETRREAAPERATLIDGLNESMAARRAMTSERVRKQTMPVVHALQHLCDMMSGILEETSLQSLVLNGAIKPQEAIMLREAVAWLDKKMSQPRTH